MFSFSEISAAMFFCPPISVKFQLILLFLLWPLSLLSIYKTFKKKNYRWTRLKSNKTAYQPYVFATEFLNNTRSRTSYETLFFLKTYQNLRQAQRNNKRVRRKQQLLTSTPSSKDYHWYFIIYSVLMGKKQYAI